MDHSSLPPLLTPLAALRRRALGLTICSALALGLAAGLGLALLWVLLEALFFLSPPWRTGLGVLALLGSGGALAFALRRHLPILLSQHRFALFVERRCPPLQQRLISALELSDADPTLHSPALLAAAGERAAALLRTADPSQVLDRGPLRTYLRLLGGTVALALLCGALFGDELAQAAQRCAHPFTTYERPPRTLITVQPGDLEIVKGEDATLQVHFAGHKPRRARIVRRPSAEAPYQIEELVVDRADSVAYTFPQVQRSFRYAIAAGDDRSPEYEVRVIDPPAVKHLRLHYQYPAYSQLPDRIEEEGGDIQGLPGTRVTLEIAANKPLSKATYGPRRYLVAIRPARRRDRPHRLPNRAHEVRTTSLSSIARACKTATPSATPSKCVKTRSQKSPSSIPAATATYPSPSRCCSKPRPPTTFPSRKSP